MSSSWRNFSDKFQSAGSSGAQSCSAVGDFKVSVSLNFLVSLDESEDLKFQEKLHNR